MSKYNEFGSALKRLMVSYDIRNIEVAEQLEVQPPFVSMVLTGRKIFTPEQYYKLTQYISSKISREEEDELNHLYYYAKMGNSIPLESIKPIDSKINLDNMVTTVGEKMLLKSFRALNEKAQMQVIEFVRQKEIDMLDLMAELAGVEEEQAPYGAAPKKANSGGKTRGKGGVNGGKA